MYTTHEIESEQIRAVTGQSVYDVEVVQLDFDFLALTNLPS
jgi:hypothetical protein